MEEREQSFPGEEGDYVEEEEDSQMDQRVEVLQSPLQGHTDISALLALSEQDTKVTYRYS